MKTSWVNFCADEFRTALRKDWKMFFPCTEGKCEPRSTISALFAGGGGGGGSDSE